MEKIAIFASHNGSGFDAIFDAIKNNELNLSIAFVLTNNSNANVLQKAKLYGIETFVVNSKNTQDIEKRMNELLHHFECSNVFLSGYMKKIARNVTQNFSIINSHPSLLPKYGGIGMYGRFVHEAIIQNNETFSGVTVHRVDGEYDSGSIILQERLQLSKTETVDSLETKVKALEKTTIIKPKFKSEVQFLS